MKLNRSFMMIITLGLLVFGIGLIYLKSIQSLVGWVGIVLMIMGLFGFNQARAMKE